MPSSSSHSSSRSDRLSRLSPHLAGLARLSIESSSDHLTLQTYSQDLWPRRHLEMREGGPVDPTVDLVIWPETTAQVTEAVRWAASADAVLIPYGAGSGVCGATIPSGGAEDRRPRVMIDLKKMRRVRAIDRKSMTVTAEAGLIGENIERHLNQENLTLGHFPSSVYCSSLGGYLATRSAGQLSTKYGKIEDMVLSLEMVMADGTVLETGRAPRSAMGPDWTQLLLGTEGTLGVFTAATMQVHEMAEERVMLGFGAPGSGVAATVLAMEFARRIMQQGLRPAVLRIYDPIETQLFLSSEVLKEAGFAGGAAIVAVFEGRKRLTQVEAEEARTIAREMELQDLGPRLGEHWWNHRYDVSYKQQLILSHDRMILDTFELCGSWDKLEGIYRAVKGVSAGLGVIMAHFSHFYHTGANIYFTLVSHSGFSKSAVAQYDGIWERMLAAAHESGATLSHHHGVGVQKNEWIRKEKQEFVRIFEKVKRGFDPENRLNPGKMGL